MTIRSVTGNIKDLAGVSIPNATFSLLPETYAFGATSSEAIFGDQVTVLSDSSGGVSFDIHEGKYIGRISTTQGPKTFRLVVDSEGPWTLGRLIDASIGEITPSLIQQAFDAAQDAAQSAIDAADASRLDIGTVDGGATAAATITGDAGSQLLNLVLPAGADGADGADGQGVAVGGTEGQVLAKASATDFDTAWVDSPEPPELTPEQATDPASAVFGTVSGGLLSAAIAEAGLHEPDFTDEVGPGFPGRNTITTFTHGLGAVPSRVEIYAICTTANRGYVVDDKIQLPPHYWSANGGHVVAITSADVRVIIATAGTYTLGADTRTNLEISANANWKLRVEVWE